VPSELERLPADPYGAGGATLVYGPAASGGDDRVLYSVGPDRVDQLGLPLDPLTGRGDIPYPVR
jgi:hypothetical protein